MYSLTPPRRRARGSVYFGSSVGGLLDFEELAQVIGANHTDLADFDERERPVAHQIVNLTAAQPGDSCGVIDAISERAVVL
jgi:hypothetical protein